MAKIKEGEEKDGKNREIKDTLAKKKREAKEQRADYVRNWNRFRYESQ